MSNIILFVVQTFGDLVHWHPHIHAIVAEGVFTQDGQFEPVTNIRLEQAIELWRDKVFDILFEDGKILYRANHPRCTRFPALGQEMDLRPGMMRNYQLFDPLDFLASVTQHIPGKGDHQIRYYGWYSNKSRSLR